MLGKPIEAAQHGPGVRSLTMRHLNRIFHEAAEAAGIRKTVTLHALRHSFATPVFAKDGGLLSYGVERRAASYVDRTARREADGATRSVPNKI